MEYSLTIITHCRQVLWSMHILILVPCDLSTVVLMDVCSARLMIIYSQKNRPIIFQRTETVTGAAPSLPLPTDPQRNYA